MDVSPEHLVEQANERFQLQDYYGAIHLLEEVIATGRAFADAHHVALGIGLHVGQPGRAKHFKIGRSALLLLEGRRRNFGERDQLFDEAFMIAIQKRLRVAKCRARDDRLHLLVGALARNRCRAQQQPGRDKPDLHGPILLDAHDHRIRPDEVLHTRGGEAGPLQPPFAISAGIVDGGIGRLSAGRHRRAAAADRAANAHLAIDAAV